MIWTRISLLLCVFGFLKEFKPSDPFIFEYLTGPWKNFTREQIYQEVLPVATYSKLATALPVLLLTDFLRYKPVVILCGLSGCCSQIVVVLFKNLWAMKIVYILRGLSYSTELAYFTYLYAKVDKKHYQEVTSHTNAAILLGRFAASVIAQILVSFGLLNYHQLNHLTLSSLAFGAIWTFFLPSVNQPIDVNSTTVCNTGDSLPLQMGSETIESTRNTDELNHSQPARYSEYQNTSLTSIIRIEKALHILWKDFLLAYSQCYVVIWSAWWVFGHCGWRQVNNYIQVLWQTPFTEAHDVYNAATHASQTILSALASFGVGKLKFNWPAITQALLAVSMTIQGILLFVVAETHNIWLSYAAYIGFCIIFQVLLGVASSEIAKNVPENSYGLVIGLNTFVALSLQTILTFTVTENWGFALAIRPQYFVYASCFMVVSVIFAAMAVYAIVKQCRSRERFHR